MNGPAKASETQPCFASLGPNRRGSIAFGFSIVLAPSTGSPPPCLSSATARRFRLRALPDNAKKGIEVKFEPKTVKWLALMVTGVSPTTQNVGLSEIAVFRAASAFMHKSTTRDE